MEDSYTVHRRRKAAARRREKTPEATRASTDAADGLDEEDVVDDKTESLEIKEDCNKKQIIAGFFSIASYKYADFAVPLL